MDSLLAMADNDQLSFYQRPGDMPKHCLARNSVPTAARLLEFSDSFWPSARAFGRATACRSSPGHRGGPRCDIASVAATLAKLPGVNSINDMNVISGSGTRWPRFWIGRELVSGIRGRTRRCSVARTAEPRLLEGSGRRAW
jgi:hypothetical protein